MIAADESQFMTSREAVLFVASDGAEKIPRVRDNVSFHIVISFTIFLVTVTFSDVWLSTIRGASIFL